CERAGERPRAERGGERGKKNEDANRFHGWLHRPERLHDMRGRLWHGVPLSARRNKGAVAPLEPALVGGAGAVLKLERFAQAVPESLTPSSEYGALSKTGALQRARSSATRASASTRSHKSAPRIHTLNSCRSVTIDTTS